MKRKLLLSLFVVFTMSVFAKEEKLNGSWTFRFQDEMEIQNIEIPHTWNALDTIDQVKGYRQDVGIYECKFELEPVANKRYFLRFDAANQTAEVYLNGRKVSYHEGGYTAFTFEITNELRSGRNKLIVNVDNRDDDNIMPLVGDFNFYGGIYRDVWLIEKDSLAISPLNYGSAGVYFSQNTSKEKSDFVVKTLVMGSNADAKVRAIIKDADGKTVFTAEAGVDASDCENSDFLSEIKGTINNPILWNGVENPYLYTLEVNTLVDGEVTDTYLSDIGFRFFEIGKKIGFSLNGEHYKVQGVCRHQDKAGLGFALSDEDHKLDFELMAEMGVNSVRFSHYPHAKIVYQLADKAGIVTYAEIPFVGPGGYAGVGFTDSDEFKANGRQQLKEMIFQNYNHPSIVFWGLYNELNNQANKPYDYLTELNSLVKEIDPDRITVGATNVEQKYNDITDVIAWNKYFGWYGSQPRIVGPWLDSHERNYPDRINGISEYGAGGSINHHTEKDYAPIPTGKFHPENWQAKFHEEHWKNIYKRDYVWGSYVWNMFDFASHHRTEGDADEINDKGLVTHDRKVKKDAFYFYKANWNPEDEFVYIANKRFTENRAKSVRLKVYSNLPEVRYEINGSKQMKLKDTGFGIFELKRLKLNEGENIIKVYGYKDGKLISEDTCTWNR